MIRKTLLLAAATILMAGPGLIGCGGQESANEQESSSSETAQSPAEGAAGDSVQKALPQGVRVDVASIQWETNNEDPTIGDPGAVQGGVFKTWIDAYPLTFRLVGPDSNDGFAGWKRSYTQDFALVRRHPTTDNFIPFLATHWKVMEDNQTIYFKLDQDARWSDGTPITADDYVFCDQMMRSPHIVDPYYNDYFGTHFAAVEAIDPYTLRIVGMEPSWRPLDDYAIWPMPRHFHKLDENWVKNYNLELEPVPGPYVVKERTPGQRIVFERMRPWWGDEKRYFKGMYNADKIDVMVILDGDKAFDHFQKGDISHYIVTSAKRWAEEMNFDALNKGWAHRKRLFVEYPQGVYGFSMNLERPIFQNKDFRKAVQYAFNFEELNKNLMYDAYYRIVSAFEGTEYENKDLTSYGFDPVKCREHLTAAGYTKRGNDGIFVNDSGQRASFTLTYGSSTLTRHMTVIKQGFQGLGIEMQLSLLEPGVAFQRGLEREYEMTIMSRTSNLFPSPRQYFGSIFTQSKNNNNIWAFGSPHTDELIDIYEKNMDKAARVAAMHELDAIVQDEAFYVPFWQSPFVRFLYWDGVEFPTFYFPRRYEQLSDWQVFWIDQARQEKLVAAMKENKAYEPDLAVDQDPYEIKAILEKSMSQVAG